MKTVLGITKELDKSQLLKLNSFAIHYNKIMRHLYVDLYIKKLNLNELTSSYQIKYLISRRHFSSIHVVLRGKVNAILATNKKYIADTEIYIKKIEKTLKTQHKNYIFYTKRKDTNGKLEDIEKSLKEKLNQQIKFNHKKLDKLQNKLLKLKKIDETGNVHLCFGSNKLFKQQFSINKENVKSKYKNKEQWYKDYSFSRNKDFTFVGSKDETSGNQSAIITHLQNNLFSLKLNINHKTAKIEDKTVNINFTINYETQTLINIIKNNSRQQLNKDLRQALTYKLIRQPSDKSNKYIVAISFEKHLDKSFKTLRNKGCLGVDINQDHLAVVDLDNKGNLLKTYIFEYNLNGNKHQNYNSISLAIKSLMEIAVKLNKPIVMEELDFNNKKTNRVSGGKVFNRKKNKQLSSFAYGKIIQLIKDRAEDNKIEVIQVNPAYTSIIGEIKYSARNKIGIHHSAAICIGRKALFNKSTQEKLSKKTAIFKEKRISYKDKYINILNLPVRNNLRWDIYWKELKENIKKKKHHEKEITILNIVNKSTSLQSLTGPVISVSDGSSL